MRPSALLALLLALPSFAQDEPAPAEDPGDRIIRLISEMSIEEKVGQMTQLSLAGISSSASTPENPGAHQLDDAKVQEALKTRHVGSIVHTHDMALSADKWQQLITSLQQTATTGEGPKVPLLYGIDSIHGANFIEEATLFPHQLGLAATWNPDLVERCFATTAQQTRAVGISWNFSPSLDVARQPLWSRYCQTFGEDVLLTTTLGQAAVRGLQGDDLSAADRVAATGKHFLAPGMSYSGRDRTPVLIPDRYLREYFLPPFWDAIDHSQLKTLMVNSGEINGIPVHANYSILTRLLREQMGFDGVVVTGWDDIRALHTTHRIAPDMREAVRIAIDAGIDVAMTPGSYEFTDELVAMVKEGFILEERIDESVARILRLKTELGLFENHTPSNERLTTFLSTDAADLSKQAAQESLVLLKNTGVLPLAPESKILLTGPGCTSLPALHGPYSYTTQGADPAAYPQHQKDILTSFNEAHGRDNVLYAPGIKGDWINDYDLDRAERAAQRVDAIVCILNELPSTGSPGDVNNLQLSAAQTALVKAVSFGKPVIVVLLQNRPRLITEIDSYAHAVIHASYPGPHGGTAIHDLLFGKFNPSGKLPFTYPRHPNALLPYDLKPTDTTTDPNPLYPFGHGLSYTTFNYENLTLAVEEVEGDDPTDLPPGVPPLPEEKPSDTPEDPEEEPAPDDTDESETPEEPAEEPKFTVAEFDTLLVSVDLTNTGQREGTEVVQLYVRDLYASITPPAKRLRAFQKVTLAPGETKTINFKLPVEDLSFIGTQNTWQLEPGDFELTIGNQSTTFTAR